MSPLETIKAISKEMLDNKMKKTFQVGHRYLVEDNDAYPKSLIEIEILEISPGKRIKFKYCNSGLTEWTDNKDIYGNEPEFKIIEDLGDTRLVTD